MSIYTDDTVKRLRFFNGDIEITKYVVPKSLKIQDYLCTGQLNFGEANSAKAQFKTSEDLQLTGSRILITFGTDEESAPVGTYKVTYSSHKANTAEVTITAYDAVKEFDKNIAQWYNALSWPITLGTFRKSLCDYIGIEAVETSLVNDTVQLEETIAPSSLNGIEMLFYIGQLNGVFAHANSDYKLEWVSLGTTVNEIPKSVTYGPKAYEAKSYNTAPIGGLVIRQEDGDVGVSFGTSNKYVVQGNVLVYGCTTDELNIIANRLYDKIKDIQYVPCTIKMKYLPDIKMGSRCSYEGNVFYVMQRSTSGLLFDTIKAGGNEYLESDTSIETKLEQLRGMSNVLNRKIEQNQLTISDVEKGLKDQITQNAEKFSVELEALQAQVDGDIKQYNVDYEPTLTNYPAWDFTYNIPCNDTVQVSDDLAFIYKDSYYSRNARTIVFDKSTSTTYRFVNEDGNWFWKAIGDTEYGIAMSKIASLEVTTENISSSVSSLDYKITNEYITTEKCNALITLSSNSIKQEVSAEYAKKSLLDDYSTTVKMNAAIKLAADGITQTVSESYATKTSLSETQQLADKINWLVKSGTSSANMELTSDLYKVLADNITLKGKHIQLDGDTTVGSGFKLSCDVLNGGTINGQILNGCTMSGGAISIGGNNVIMNESGIWVIGSDSTNNPKFKVDNSGNLTLAGTAYMTNSVVVTGALSVTGSINATGQLSASNINATGGKIGNWAIGSGAIANNGVVLGSDGNVILSGDGNKIELKDSKSGSYPTSMTAGALYVGGQSTSWFYILKAGQAQTSDERIKQDVATLYDDKYEAFFDSLSAKTYRFKEGNGLKTDKIHIGFIAQKIKENMDNADLSNLAVYDDDNPDLLGVNKQELIALCVWQIQKLKSRVKKLEKQAGVMHEEH